MAELTPTNSVLGQPHKRVDGLLKVTGRAVFPADEQIPNLAYARLITAPIGPGRIKHINYEAARVVPGVLAILTYETVGPNEIQPVRHMMSGGYVNSSVRPLASAEIFYSGQIVALVAADTLEAATEAAGKLAITYVERRGTYTLDAPAVEARLLSDIKPGHKDRSIGDVESALTHAHAVVDESYSTPIQHHNPMELFTTTCVWSGSRLTVLEPTRYVVGVQHGLAAQLGMDAKNVRVIARFLGGHFGSKLGLPQYTALVAIAARRIKRPLTLATTRTDGFSIANHRPDTRHRIKLGADSQGKLIALSHEATSSTSRFDSFVMEGADVTSGLYACPNVTTRELSAQVDRNTPGPMRAPPEVPYLFAMESAIDELAYKLNMDPIEFRRINDTNSDPVTGKLFTTRALMRCFDRAAATIKWQQRRHETGRLRVGDNNEWLVGFGCASAARPVKIGAAIVRIKLTAELKVTVETAHHEIGNGLYTVLAMAAADKLGLSPAAITVYLGDTALPAAGVSGGSATTTTLVNALAQGCATIRERLIDAAVRADGQFVGAKKEGMRINDGRLVSADGRAVELTSLIEQRFGGRLETIVEYLPPGMGSDAIAKLQEGHSALVTDPEDKLAWTFGAQFARVHVHSVTGEIRVPQLVGCFAAGRVLNPLTANSQLIGGMIWGLGSALLEATEVDVESGAYVNSNFAEYLVATAADVGEVTALTLEDDDREVNTEGIKGIGEIGIIGVNAAIANAIFNATGRRIRSLPITLDKML